jgi:hypothetical protein
MNRTHYRIFNERTGSPETDNQARRTNRLMSRRIRESFTVSAGKSGWRRKKMLTKKTMVELIHLHLAVMKQLQDREPSVQEPADGSS